MPECTVVDTSHSPGRIVRGMCDLHLRRFYKHGDPLRKDKTPGWTRGNTYGKRTAGAANGQWKGIDAGYKAVHMRVKNAHGTARDHTCVDCKEPALEWSYDHTDPNELSSEFGPYSTDISKYDPRCVPCHRLFDHGVSHV